MPGGRPPVDPVKRFLSKVKPVESGCHEWQAGLARGGYGKFMDAEHRTLQAHRASYQFFKGEIPDGMCVMHQCDNRLCVNPAHLTIGTLADNIADMDAKDRRGTKSPFTRAQADEILALLKTGLSQQKIADLYGVGQTVISRIALGKTTKFKEQ
jgi:predicted XRE-type DNA-binding protein